MTIQQHTDILGCWQSNGTGRHHSQHTGGVLQHGLCQSRWFTRTCRGQEISKIFIPSIIPYLSTLALETLGPINSTGISFLAELGRRLADVSGDSCYTMNLFPQVSLVVQH